MGTITGIWEKIKGFAGWLVAAGVALLYVFILRKQNQDLKEELGVEKVKDEMDDILDEREKARKDADTSEADFRAKFNAVLKQRASSGGQAPNDTTSMPGHVESGSDSDRQKE